MLTNKPLWGAIAGTLIATIWVAFDTGAVLLVLALASIGWLIGKALEKPEALISLLERLQDH